MGAAGACVALTATRIEARSDGLVGAMGASKPKFNVCGVECIAQWNAQEFYDELPNGSRVYLFGLKAQDASARYAKLRGLTLAGIFRSA